MTQATATPLHSVITTADVLAGRLSAGTGGLEALTSGQVFAWLGLGTAAFYDSGDYAAAVHSHIIADVTGLQTALDGKADLVGGVLPTSQLPALAVTEYLGTVADQAAMLASSGQKGDWVTRADTGSTWIITGDDPTQLAGWTELSYPAAPVTSVNSQTGSVALALADLDTSVTGAQLDSLKAKVDGVEAGATADQSDAEIETAYNNQVEIVSQVIAEAGTSTTVYRWTPERVAQAIAALGGGGGGAPGGANTQIQFNNAGAFGGSAQLVWNGTTLIAAAAASTDTPFRLKAASAQSGDLMQIDSVSGSSGDLVRWLHDGMLQLPSGAFNNVAIRFGSDMYGFAEHASGIYIRAGTGGDAYITNGRIGINSDHQYAWSPSASFPNTSPDTGLARDAAGVVRVTNGSTGLGRLRAVAAERVLEVTTASASIGATDSVVAVRHTTTAAVTLTLPLAASVFDSGYGSKILIKDAGGNASVNNITINRAGSDTIITTATGATSTIISVDGGAVWLQAISATEWAVA